MKVIVTGGSSGIGKAFVFGFHQLGYEVITCGRRKNPFEFIRRIKYFQGDLVDRSNLKPFFDFIEENMEGTTILVNNVGFGDKRNFKENYIESMNYMLDLHVGITINLTKILINELTKNKGTIINMSSLASFFPNNKNEMYSSTKAFLNMFSKSLNLNKDIKVKCVCPGFVNTEFAKHKKNGITPERVFDYTYKNLNNKKIILIPGFKEKVYYNFSRIVPSSLYNYLYPKIVRGFWN